MSRLTFHTFIKILKVFHFHLFHNPNILDLQGHIGIQRIHSIHGESNNKITNTKDITIK